MATTPVFLVDPPGIAEGQILHDWAQRFVLHLNGKMEVVGHATETMNPMAIALDSLLEQPIQVMPVFVIEENILAPIPPKNHMINPSRDMKSWFSGHDPLVIEWTRLLQ